MCFRSKGSSVKACVPSGDGGTARTGLSRALGGPLPRREGPSSGGLDAEPRALEGSQRRTRERAEPTDLRFFFTFPTQKEGKS